MSPEQAEQPKGPALHPAVAQFQEFFGNFVMVQMRSPIVDVELNDDVPEQNRWARTAAGVSGQNRPACDQEGEIISTDILHNVQIMPDATGLRINVLKFGGDMTTMFSIAPQDILSVAVVLPISVDPSQKAAPAPQQGGNGSRVWMP
jgi:hypothetical protein